MSKINKSAYFTCQGPSPPNYIPTLRDLLMWYFRFDSKPTIMQIEHMSIPDELKDELAKDSHSRLIDDCFDDIQEFYRNREYTNIFLFKGNWIQRKINRIWGGKYRKNKTPDLFDVLWI